MDIKLRNELIAEKLRLAEATQISGDTFVSKIIESVPLSMKPHYIPRTEKRRNRILLKIDQYMAEDSQIDLRSAVNRIKDYAGGRILTHYIGDVKPIYEHICEIVKRRRDIRLDGPCNDCTHSPRSSGFRALIQVVLFHIQPDIWFPFEIQIMTFLADDWDQKQHIIYESQAPIPEHIQAIFGRLSLELFKADQTFDAIRSIVKAFISRNRH